LKYSYNPIPTAAYWHMRTQVLTAECQWLLTCKHKVHTIRYQLSFCFWKSQ